MDYSSLFTSFPILHTARLTLRRIMPEDAADAFEMRSDPEVMRYIPRPLAITVEDVLPVIKLMEEGLEKGERLNWGITLKGEDKVIGMIGYVNIHAQHSRAEVGYSLTRAYHRQGIMREALIRVIKYGFKEMELHSIEAITDAENVASGNLLKAVGFRQEAYFREDFFCKDSFRDSIHYGLLHSDPYQA